MARSSSELSSGLLPRLAHRPHFAGTGLKRILIRRKKGEPFLCVKCLKELTHDQAYQHVMYECPKRKDPTHVT